ncbi:hypothetical protein ACQHMI_25930, partial [Escherichia coli]|uniref:hypothetical protein n=1 Tax=Escherichia coli TaxID=562 RepID=UPI003CF823E4
SKRSLMWKEKSSCKNSLQKSRNQFDLAHNLMNWQFRGFLCAKAHGEQESISMGALSSTNF